MSNTAVLEALRLALVDQAMKQDPPAFAKALVAAQRAAEAVEKKARNEHHNYRYASAESIIDEATGALNGAGIAVRPVWSGLEPGFETEVWVGEGDSAYRAAGRRVVVVIKAVHESGEGVLFESSLFALPSKGRPDDKAELGAKTELLGYMLRDLLQLPRVDAQQPSGRDDTGYEHRGRQAPRREPPKAPPAKPAQAPAPTKAGRDFLADIAAAKTRVELRAVGEAIASEVSEAERAKFSGPYGDKLIELTKAEKGAA